MDLIQINTSNIKKIKKVTLRRDNIQEKGGKRRKLRG
jgi:hypothetical protein